MLQVSSHTLCLPLLLRILLGDRVSFKEEEQRKAQLTHTTHWNKTEEAMFLHNYKRQR